MITFTLALHTQPKATQCTLQAAPCMLFAFLENTPSLYPEEAPGFTCRCSLEKKKKNLKIELIIMKVFFCCPILIMNKIFMKCFAKLLIIKIL